MRRTTGHIRERSPGAFEVRYALGTDPATGKRKIATTTVRGTRKDAEKELRRLLRTLDTGEHVDPTRMTVRQWLATWLATVQQEVAPRSHERYASIVNHHLVPALGALQITKLGPAHIQSFYNDLAIAGQAGWEGRAACPAIQEAGPSSIKRRALPCSRATSSRPQSVRHVQASIAQSRAARN